MNRRNGSFLSAPSFRPLYEQIKGLLTQSLMSGEWVPGQAIPSELELAARYKVSQGTVRKAVDELAAEHIVVRRQGKGTFVASHAEEQIHYRFLRIASDRGERLQLESRLLQLKRERATPAIGHTLELRAGAPLLVIKRVLELRSKALIYDEIALSATLFKGLEAAALSAFKGSYYSFYEAAYGVRMIRADEQIKAVAAAGEAARVLGVAEGAPLLRVDRVAYSYDDKPVEWRRGLCITEHHCYLNELA